MGGRRSDPESVFSKRRAAQIDAWRANLAEYSWDTCLTTSATLLVPTTRAPRRRAWPISDSTAPASTSSWPSSFLFSNTFPHREQAKHWATGPEEVPKEAGRLEARCSRHLFQEKGCSPPFSRGNTCFSAGTHWPTCFASTSCRRGGPA